MSAKPSPQAVRELGQAWLRILRVREPELLWQLAPDGTQPLGDRSPPAGTGSGSDNNVLENGAE